MADQRLDPQALRCVARGQFMLSEAQLLITTPLPVIGGTPLTPRCQNQAVAKWNIWDPNDLQLFPEKQVGAGFTINLYWMRHPLLWWRATHP
jgi:hypothetical protein